MTDQELKIQSAYLLKNEIHKHGIVICAAGEDITKEIQQCSPYVEELFYGDVELESDGLWLWRGSIYYPTPFDEAIIKTESLKKIPFSSLDNVI